MELEPNNVIAQATDSGVNSTTKSNLTVEGNIDLLSEVDLYQFQLEAGQGIILDLDTENLESNATSFDSYLRVFDESGKELAFNDDASGENEEFSLDSALGFIAPDTGKYYVGVTSVANSVYDPITGNLPEIIRDKSVSGKYSLNFNLVEVTADLDPDNTISEAQIIEEQTFAGAIELESDVDLFQLNLAAGEGVKLKVNAKSIDSPLDSYLRVFDASGKELAFDDNSLNNPGEDPSQITTDSTIDFAPNIPGTYFIGVSSAGNFDYDPINGDTNLNFSTNTGISQGNYQLEAEVLKIVPDEDPDNTIAEAEETGINSTDKRSTVVEGKISPELDADLYRIQLAEGDGVFVDLEGEAIASDLDSFLRLFDAEGNELIFDDNDDTNFTGDLSRDSAIAFAPTTPGEYFIGVSAVGNFDYDPINGRNNFSSNVTSPFSTTGDYQLKIDLAKIVADSDGDNTLSEAIDSGISSEGKTSTVLEGEIDVATDADLYRFQLDEGEGITLDINAASQDSELDSYLRLFDVEGNELLFDDDDDRNLDLEDTTSDSLLNFVADTSGEYFIGVSSEGNVAYDGVNGSNNFSHDRGFSTGDYQLAIDISPVIGDEDPDNTIPEAIATGISPTGKIATTIGDEIVSPQDIDVYRFELGKGDTITLDIDAAIEGSELDSVLRLFDSSGKEIASNDDGIVGDEISSIDSALVFTAETEGVYYLGVSSFANFSYDPLNGSTNFSNDIGTSIGEYNLSLNIIDN